VYISFNSYIYFIFSSKSLLVLAFPTILVEHDLKNSRDSARLSIETYRHELPADFFNVCILPTDHANNFHGKHHQQLLVKENYICHKVCRMWSCAVWFISENIHIHSKVLKDRRLIKRSRPAVKASSGEKLNTHNSLLPYWASSSSLYVDTEFIIINKR